MNVRLAFTRPMCVAIAATCIDAAFAKDAEPRYRYTVSWDYWDYGNVIEGREKWLNMEIRVNGRSVGSRESAFRFLELLPVKAGEHVKLDLPTRSADAQPNPGHWMSNFIQRWTEKGAFVDWYEGGKKYDLHTVTWTDSIVDGNHVRNMDDLTWIVDGRKVGKGKNLLPLIEQWKKKNDLVIQIVKPLEWKRSFNADQGLYLPILESIKDGRKIRIYHIQPFIPNSSAPLNERPVERSPTETRPQLPRIRGLEPLGETKK